MNLRGYDLNLLVVLDALLDEAHVSRAAKRLGLSQPATSSALERCRHLFGDPLLERTGGGMRRSPRAETLRARLKTLLAEAADLIEPPIPDIRAIRQTVRIVMADYPAVIVVGPLHASLARSAPGIDLVIQPWQGGAAALDGLAKGTIDLAASVFPRHDPSFTRKEMLREHYRVLMRRDHPAAADFTLERWIDFPHVLVSARGETRGDLDDALAAIGRQRHVGIVVPSFIMVPPLLEGADLIAMLPSRCLPLDTAERFVVFEPPIPVPGFPLHLAWHVRRNADIAVQHVAGVMTELLEAMP
ncbi:LysR family transcriptional regulator [Chelatococcus asaccharovorans]|uniref:LysR family transcriptional regulator n=1 Tax=Chelatococcus asaccharovorans TaxID=28210 RepID=UPI00224C70E0|nr:LysR family transcriptional regulator [Chelatococcus asaccharovorans]CAH1653320.1 DNA-binding transcriptional LysR family regulator [Chelatococcus asaccharovorans]CAH1694053.1 DNA-binding transcriptional LysR family regulator [Chelatococcus asaccharovorans]